MSEEILETSATDSLNAGSIRNLPVCPMNPEVELENVDKSYSYRRLNPDTRWFTCPNCECHVGYHRMRKKWLIDPYDLDFNNKARECYGLPPTEDVPEPVEIPTETSDE
jgi:hypothetical protein